MPAEKLRGLAGVELFRQIIGGALPAPPVSAFSNQRLIGADEGLVVWEASPPDGFINPMGGVHGGWAMTVLDSALACAVQSALPAGRGCSTIEVKVNLTRPPKIGEIYRCEGRVISLGRRVGTSEAKITDERGQVVAFGTTTCLIFDW